MNTPLSTKKIQKYKVILAFSCFQVLSKMRGIRRGTETANLLKQRETGTVDESYSWLLKPIAKSEKQKMFCKKCGKNIPETSKFCPECGENHQIIKNTKSTFTAKSIFIPLDTILSGLPGQLFMTVWTGGFVGGITSLLIPSNLNIPDGLPFILFASLAFFWIPIKACYSQNKIYKKSEYKFYPDKIEYIVKSSKKENKIHRIKFNDITEVDIHHGIIQKLYGLGTVVLSNSETILFEIEDIKHSEIIYKKFSSAIQNNGWIEWNDLNDAQKNIA